MNNCYDNTKRFNRLSCAQLNPPKPLANQTSCPDVHRSRSEVSHAEMHQKLREKDDLIRFLGEMCINLQLEIEQQRVELESKKASVGNAEKHKSTNRSKFFARLRRVFKKQPKLKVTDENFGTDV